MRIRQGIVVAALGGALVACGVQPTGVVEAGEPASGPTRGMRLYYASAAGLRAVPLLDQEIKDLISVLKLLAGKPPVEEGSGLTSRPPARRLRGDRRGDQGHGAHGRLVPGVGA